MSQISQGQEIPYNRKSCTILGNVRISGIAEATGAEFATITGNESIETGIRNALLAAFDKPVIVDSKRTRFTKGVVKTVLSRFPLRDRARFITRALLRKVTG